MVKEFRCSANGELDLRQSGVILVSTSEGVCALDGDRYTTGSKGRPRGRPINFAL